MKKILITLFLLGVFFLPAKTWAMESIVAFDLEFQINRDSSVNVTESILYDFDDLQKHGIYRDIPYKYQARGGNYSLRLRDFSVTDENGVAQPFSKSSSEGNVSLKIGDADKFVTGKKTYVIRYRVGRALNYFDNHDEFYWNAIGNGWTVPIQKVNAKIVLPEEARNIKTDCFVGFYGSTERCQYLQEGNLIDFSSRSLSPSEGVTVVVGFPKGVVIEPTQTEKILETIKDNWIVGLPFVTLILMTFLWNFKGKDPQGRGTIVAQFGSPDDLTPLEAGTLVDETAHNRDLSAEIIYLATRGYLRIKRIETGVSIFKKKDYEFTKLKDGLVNDFDADIMKAIFGEKSVGTIAKMSDLKKDFHAHSRNIMKSSYESLIKRGYFPKNPKTIRTSYSVAGIVLIVLAFMLVELFGTIGLISIVASGIVIFGFAWIMPIKTEKGVLAKEHILGLKLYMSVAEKDRIEFHNAPEKSPQHFEKLLPYAMALGVTKEWAKQFEGIYSREPEWYSAGLASGFSADDLAEDMKNFSAATASVSSQASSGGSGFSGGGGGGGFGGGGGGSW